MSDTKSIKGTKTEQLLANSYMAESAAYSRYTYFSQAAKKEGYPQYSDIFAETAANELHHAKIFLKYITEGAVVTAPLGVDAGIIGTTLENLKVAVAEEQREGVDAYVNAAKVAREEGFDEIADRFEAIASVESHHEDRFSRIAARIEDGTVWKRDTPIKWQCQVCGYIYEGTTPPEKCPACYHPSQYFMPMEDNI